MSTLTTSPNRNSRRADAALLFCRSTAVACAAAATAGLAWAPLGRGGGDWAGGGCGVFELFDQNAISSSLGWSHTEMMACASPFHPDPCSVVLPHGDWGAGPSCVVV